MSSPIVVPAVAAPAVLGVQVTQGGPEALAVTGVALGLYVAIGIICVVAGLYARWKAARGSSHA